VAFVVRNASAFTSLSAAPSPGPRVVPSIAPRATAIGALAQYVSSAEKKNYQPVNITFALLEPLSPEQARSVRRKRDRHLLQVKLGLEQWNQWLQSTAEAEVAAAH